MAFRHRQQEAELINVHRVQGDQEAIIFLKNADHEFVEGLFYTAKRLGQSTFELHDIVHEITRQKDASFTVAPRQEQVVNTEEFA